VGVDKNGMNDCENKIAKIITDEPNAVFSDVGDDDDYDIGVQNTKPISEDGTNTHHHLYPDDPSGRSKNPINIFAPGGGIIVDSGQDSRGQNYITIFYKKLGSLTNVGLQIVHVENFNKNLINKSTGSGLLLGQMGENGLMTNFVGPNRKPMQGFHIHLNAFKWWGVPGKPVLALDRKGNRIKFPQGDRSTQNVKLSNLFCNN
jgi:hypothetical protein